MQVDMRHDSVLITCGALGLHHVQATQASSFHIVIDLAAILSVPSRTLSKGESDFIVSMLAAVEWLSVLVRLALEDIVHTHMWKDARSPWPLSQQSRSHQRKVPQKERASLD